MAKKEDKVLKDEHGEPLDACGIKYKNKMFYCADCGAPLTQNHDCPSCGRQIEWERALVLMRRGTYQ